MVSACVFFVFKCVFTLPHTTIPAGVTSLSDTTCSSTGGIVAPVPCALTCVHMHDMAIQHGREGRTDTYTDKHIKLSYE